MTADQPHAATRKDSYSKAADHAMSSTDREPRRWRRDHGGVDSSSPPAYALL